MATGQRPFQGNTTAVVFDAILNKMPLSPVRLRPERPGDDGVEMLQGTLDLLILRTLLPGPAHGHTIAKSIEKGSEDILQVEQGSLVSCAAPIDQEGLGVGRRGNLRK
jgi:hypothetical protein